MLLKLCEMPLAIVPNVSIRRASSRRCSSARASSSSRRRSSASNKVSSAMCNCGRSSAGAARPRSRRAESGGSRRHSSATVAASECCRRQSHCAPRTRSGLPNTSTVPLAWTTSTSLAATGPVAATAASMVRKASSCGSGQIRASAPTDTTPRRALGSFAHFANRISRPRYQRPAGGDRWPQDGATPQPSSGRTPRVDAIPARAAAATWPGTARRPT